MKYQGTQHAHDSHATSCVLFCYLSFSQIDLWNHEQKPMETHHTLGCSPMQSWNMKGLSAQNSLSPQKKSKKTGSQGFFKFASWGSTRIPEDNPPIQRLYPFFEEHLLRGLLPISLLWGVEIILLPSPQLLVPWHPQIPSNKTLIHPRSLT